MKNAAIKLVPSVEPAQGMDRALTPMPRKLHAALKGLAISRSLASAYVSK